MWQTLRALRCGCTIFLDAVAVAGSFDRRTLKSLPCKILRSRIVLPGSNRTILTLSHFLTFCPSQRFCYYMRDKNGNSDGEYLFTYKHALYSYTCTNMSSTYCADLKYWNLNTLQQGPLKDRLPHENNRTYGLPCLVLKTQSAGRSAYWADTSALFRSSSYVLRWHVRIWSFCLFISQAH